MHTQSSSLNNFAFSRDIKNFTLHQGWLASAHFEKHLTK